MILTKKDLKEYLKYEKKLYGLEKPKIFNSKTYKFSRVHGLEISKNI